MTEIRGNFVCCGSPILDDNNKLVGWTASLVKLTEIKSIHHLDEKNCRIFTYKDQWYSVYMHMNLLCEAINEHLNANRNPHGRESGNTIRRPSVPET